MRILAIAWNTHKEASRQPIYFILIALCVVLICLSFFFTFFAFGEEVKLIKDMGLATITVGGLLIALFASANVITNEIEKKTVLTVLCKPVVRWEFLLGKYVGLLLAVLIAVLVMGFFFCLALYVNSHATKDIVPMTVSDFPPLLKGVFGCFLQITVLTAVAVALSTRLPMVVNVVACFSLYIVGHLSEYVYHYEGVRRFLEEQGHAVRAFARVLYAAVPNLENFNVSGAIALGHPISAGYLAVAALYAATYSAIALAVGVALFQEKDLA